MKLGKLGEQIVLKSKESFHHLQYKGAMKVCYLTYYGKRMRSDEEARESYCGRLKEMKFSNSEVLKGDEE